MFPALEPVVYLRPSLVFLWAIFKAVLVMIVAMDSLKLEEGLARRCHLWAP
jgi:hypothetical protein